MDEEFDPVTRPEGYCCRGGIEPLDFLLSNDVPYAEGNVIKYVFRWRRKGGLQDLYKAREYLRRLIEGEEHGGRADEP